MRGQRFHHQPVVVERNTRFDDREIEIAGDDPRQNHRPVADRHVDDEMRVAPQQTPHRGPHRDLGRERSGTDSQQPDLEPEQLLNVLLDLVRLIEQRSRVCDEPGADSRGFDV